MMILKLTVLLPFTLNSIEFVYIPFISIEGKNIEIEIRSYHPVFYLSPIALNP